MPSIKMTISKQASHIVNCSASTIKAERSAGRQAAFEYLPFTCAHTPTTLSSQSNNLYATMSHIISGESFSLFNLLPSSPDQSKLVFTWPSSTMLALFMQVLETCRQADSSALTAFLQRQQWKGFHCQCEGHRPTHIRHWLIVVIVNVIWKTGDSLHMIAYLIKERRLIRGVALHGAPPGMRDEPPPWAE